MLNKINRDEEYINSLKTFIQEKYNIAPISITPAQRGYYGETWRLETKTNKYFVKLDYFPRHQKLFQNSLPVVNYLCNNGIDFINKVVKTSGGELHSVFNSAVLGIFEWIDGENIETDGTKIPEYQMLCKIYPLTVQGFDIPTIEFSNSTAIRFYGELEKLKNAPLSDSNRAVLEILEQKSEKLSRRAKRLAHFASICQNDRSDFYITHGDAGGNFFVGGDRNYIIDWDEVMYAPLERDAWVMCCRDWARKLFNDRLKGNNINYQLRPERLAFYCYHMFFLYLSEFLEDFLLHGVSDSIIDYLNGGWIEERVLYADTI